MLTVNDFIYGMAWDPPTKVRLCNCTKRSNKCPANRTVSAWLWSHKQTEKARARGRMLAAHGGRKILIARLKIAFAHTCQYCGARGDDKGVGADMGGFPLYWTIDRIRPDGDYSPQNITLACHGCNSAKQAKPLRRAVLSLEQAEASHV